MHLRRSTRWLLVILWACFILYMSSHSTPPGDPITRTAEILKSIGITLPLVPGKSLAFTIINPTLQPARWGFEGVLPVIHI
ncbi:MAG: hypothetical protein Q8S19_02520 [Bacillota bacterium]|nr:hypothetical protein [Bacillota bacterium]